MEKILLVEDTPADVDDFLERFHGSYEIVVARGILSAIEAIDQDPEGYALFVLDANLPEEDPPPGHVSSPNTPGSWQRIYRVLESKLGARALDRTMIRTKHKQDADATGKEVLAVPKEYGLGMFEVMMKAKLNVYPNVIPRVFLASRHDENVEKILEYFSRMGAYIEHSEDPNVALSAVDGRAGIAHLLIVSLSLPFPLEAPEARPVGSPLPPSFLNAVQLIEQARTNAPLTQIVAVCPPGTQIPNLSMLLSRLGVTRVAQPNDDLHDFCAETFGALVDEIGRLRRCGDGLNPEVDLRHAATLLTGEWRSPQETELSGWAAFRGNKAHLLLRCADDRILVWLTEILGRNLPRGTAICVRDFQGMRGSEALGAFREAVQTLQAEPGKRVLILLHADRQHWTLDAGEARVLRTEVQQCEGLHVVIAAAPGKESVTKPLESIIARDWMSHEFPMFRAMSKGRLRAAVLSYLLTYATYRKKHEVYVNEDVFEFIGERVASYTTAELLRILTDAFDIGLNRPLEARVRITVADVGSAFTRFQPAPELTLATWSAEPSIPEGDKKLISFLLSTNHPPYDIIGSVQQLVEGKSGARLYAIRAQSKPVDANRPYDCPRVLVKIGKPHKMLEEIQNYEAFVKVFQGRNVARIENYWLPPTESGLAAIQYSYVRGRITDQNLEDFATFAMARDATLPRLQSVLESLFYGLLTQNWYTPTREDLDFAGFMWFYGAHLPALLEVTISGKESIHIPLPNTPPPEEKAMIWDLFETVERESEVNTTLHDIVFPEPQHSAPGDKNLKVLHASGAIIKLVGEGVDWGEIRQLLPPDRARRRPRAITGVFRSSQRRLMQQAIEAGFRTATRHPDLSNQELKFSARGDSLANPLFEYLGFLRETDRITQARGIMHGDLHWRNVLVENSSDEPSAWLIDFGRTGLGPLVFDAVQLEVDMLVNVIRAQRLGDGSRYEVEDVIRILELARDEGGLRAPRSPRRPLGNNRGAAMIVHSIRQFVIDYLPPGRGGKNWYPYFVGMCLYSLGLLRYQPPNESPSTTPISQEYLKSRLCCAIAAYAASQAKLLAEDGHVR